MWQAKYMYMIGGCLDGARLGQGGRINKINITKYSRRHLWHSLPPVHCSAALGSVTKLPFPFPLCTQAAQSSKPWTVCFFPSGTCGFGVCLWLCMDVRPLCGSLLEVGVVRKGIDILLDHFVAELILLLNTRERTSEWWVQNIKHTTKINEPSL